MILLGKYFQTFTVTIDEFDPVHNIPVKGLSCQFRERQCFCAEIYEENVVLTLITNDQQDCIQIDDCHDI